jgi:hypothetical protein
MASRLLRYRIQYTEKQKRWNRKMSGLLLCSPDRQSVFPMPSTASSHRTAHSKFQEKDCRRIFAGISHGMTFAYERFQIRCPSAKDPAMFLRLVQ